MTEPVHIHPSSYRDPAGFVFMQQGKIYRQVNQQYAIHYELLMNSGLYEDLIRRQWLIPHVELSENNTGAAEYYKTLLPQQFSFISYPYEWSFDMLKDAALLTLKINLLAIQHGMILKDATPFNIQFQQGNPIFIDTLSFEKYDETKPWIAYRQFCSCFLFPLYLAYYTKMDAARLLCIYPDGISADTTANLLPYKSRFNLGVWMHVYLQKNIQQKNISKKQHTFSFTKKKMLLLMDGLTGSIKKLSLNTTTTWSNYYEETILSKDYLQAKEKVFREYLDLISFTTVVDLGANDGYFSRIAGEKATMVVATDFDSKCINNLYKEIKTRKAENILPLVIDLSNPSPAIGFNNKERNAFVQRANPDLVLALALVHHLHFSNNIPLINIAEQMHVLTGNYLIIEFVPMEDEKVQLLLQGKEHWHANYNNTTFKDIFKKFFSIEKESPVQESKRVLYLMKKINR